MDPAKALAGIPTKLRQELIDAFTLIVRNYRERRWEPSELNGGKLCEVVHSILRGHVDGKMPARATKPKNMVDACKALENAAPTFPRSVRIQIPRMLIGLYEIRNNRGVGHVGGDVDPNNMDARVVLESAKWIMAELVRVFHGLSVDDAVNVVDGLVTRTVPMVWTVGSKRRVLQPDLRVKEQTLLLLYSATGAVSESDLFEWVEYSSAAHYRRDVLKQLHADRLIEFDAASGMVELSPTGIDFVEQKLPLELK